MAVVTIVIVSLVSVVTVIISTDEIKQKQMDKIVEKIQTNEAPVLVSLETGSRQQASALDDDLEHSVEQHLNTTDNKGKVVANDGKVKKKQNKNEKGKALQTAVNTASDLKYEGEGGSGQSKNQSNPATRSLGSSGQDHSADKGADSDGGVVDNEAVTAKSDTPGSGSISGSGNMDANGDGGAVVSVSEEAQKASEKAEDEAIDNSDATPKEKELLHAARKLNKPRKVDPETGEQIERKILPLKPVDEEI